jgi:ubiquinone biosynthesis monooxygenase Coq7
MCWISEVHSARLKLGESIGDRIMKVDHAGEHGAVCIYRAQRWMSRLRSPGITQELDRFLAHEMRHRAIFSAELERRGRSRCRSYHLCGFGGLLLGLLTGLAGNQAISATTVAIEKVVLRHLAEQQHFLAGIDQAAADAVGEIIAEEQDHHDTAERQLDRRNLWVRLIEPIVAASTNAVIWLGMRL